MIAQELIEKCYQQTVEERDGRVGQLQRTRERMASSSPFIAQIGTCVMLALVDQIERLNEQIYSFQNAFGFGIYESCDQIPFPFLYECFLDEDEIPF